MFRNARLGMLLAVVFASTSLASAAEWGDLTGRFIYDGKAPAPKSIKVTKDPEVCSKHKLVEEQLVVGPQGELANIIVFLRTAKPTVHPDLKDAKGDVVLDNLNCRFEPHVALLQTSQALVIKNSDPTGHNTNITSFNAPFNQSIPIQGEVKTFFKAEEKFPLKVACNIHPWMNAVLVIRGNPYMAVSDSEGRFTIAKLPVGKELEFQLWHETQGFVKGSGVKGIKGAKVDNRGRFKMKIKPGANDLGEIRIDPSVVKPKG